MKKHGKEAFLAYYRTLFDSDDAFQDFLTKLSIRTKPVLRIRHDKYEEVQQLWKNIGLTWAPLDWYRYAVSWPKEVQLGTPLPGFIENYIYPMNPSSLLPVLALDAHPSETILDAAAAPGGKTLMIADQMQKSGKLLANELSAARLGRLKTLLSDFNHEWVETRKSNAAILFRETGEFFDRILLDAPCSSEKHVWNSPKHLKEWSLGRVRRLASRQYGLLSGVWRALKPGGRLVYSTCAVTPEENEQVVERFLEKYPNAKLLPWSQKPLPGDGEFMRRIKPDDIFDPMFVATIEKL